MTKNNRKKLYSLPAREAEQKFNALSLGNQMTAVLQAPWEERERLILLSEHAGEIVKNLPVEEFYWTVKASGPADALVLIGLAKPSQLQFIFDMDWWTQDTLAPDRITSWLLLMSEADVKCLSQWIEWIRHNDDLLLAAMLYPFVRVFKRPDEMEIQEAVDRFPPFTLDNNYFIMFRPEKLTLLLELFVNRLMEHSPGLYIDTMEIILEMTASSLTELAFKRRTGRLNDAGIPDYYESLSIHANMTPDEAASVKIMKSEMAGNIETAIMPAFVPTLYMADYPFLNEAVSVLAGTPAMERIIMEWTGVTNKLLLVEQTDFDDPEILKEGLVATSALLNAGLDIMIHARGKTSAEWLKSMPLEYLVRVANTRMKQLAKRAKSIFTEEWTLKYMPSDWLEYARGLMHMPPLVWNEKEMRLEHLSSVKQANELEKMLDTAKAWLILLENITPPCSSWERNIDWTTTNYGLESGFTWDAALATVFVNCITGQGTFMVPLSHAQVRDAARMLMRTLKTADDYNAIKKVFELCMVEIAGKSGLTLQELHDIFHKAVEPFVREINLITKMNKDEDDTGQITDDLIFSRNLLIEDFDGQLN